MSKQRSAALVVCQEVYRVDLSGAYMASIGERDVLTETERTFVVIAENETDAIEAAVLYAETVHEEQQPPITVEPGNQAQRAHGPITFRPSVSLFTRHDVLLAAGVLTDLQEQHDEATPDVTPEPPKEPASGRLQ